MAVRTTGPGWASSERAERARNAPIPTAVAAKPVDPTAAGEARGTRRRLSALAASSDEPLRIDLAVRDWARRERTVAERLGRVDNRRMDYLRSLFGALSTDEDDVEARCMVFYSLWIGNHFIAADHGARSRADVVKLALRRLDAY